MRSQIIRNTLMLAAAGVAFWPKPASAQTDSYSVIEEPAVTSEINVNAGYMHRFETDIDESDGGKFSVDALRVGLSGSVGSGPALVTGLFNYELNNYSWSDVGSDPWEQINIFRFGALMRWTLDDQWQVYGGPMFMFSGESGADAGDTFTGGGLAGFGYKMSDTLTLGLAVGMFSQLQEDAKFFAIPTVNWKFAEQWALRVGYLDLGSSGGPGAEVGYTLNEKWKFSGGLLYQKRRFRLEEDDFVAQDTSVPIYLKATWMATEKVALDFIGGVTAGGELKVDNGNGHEVGSSDYDPSLFIGVRGNVRF